MAPNLILIRLFVPYARGTRRAEVKAVKLGQRPGLIVIVMAILPVFLKEAFRAEPPEAECTIILILNWTTCSFFRVL